MRGVLDHPLEFLSDLPFHSRFTQFPSTPPSTPLNPNKPNTYTASAPVTPHTRPRLPLSTSLPLYRSTTARGHRAAPPTHTTRGLLQPGHRRRRRRDYRRHSPVPPPALYLSTALPPRAVPRRRRGTRRAAYFNPIVVDDDDAVTDATRQFHLQPPTYTNETSHTHNTTRERAGHNHETGTPHTPAHMPVARP